MIKNYSDNKLILLAKKGNKLAFEEIFRRYKGKAYGLALRISRKPEEAEEILQETFINVFRKINSFNFDSAFSSWLYKVTANTALMRLRKCKRHKNSRLEDYWDNEKGKYTASVMLDHIRVNASYVTHEIQEHLISAINSLPVSYRQVFILRDVDGFSNKEAGDLLGCTVPAIKAMLHRARVILKEKLGTYYKDYSSREIIPAKDFFKLAKAA